MNILKLFTIGLSITLASCNATKNTATDTPATNETVKTMTHKALDAKHENEGYSIGKVRLTDTACTVILEVEKTGAKFDPINIDEKRFSAYKKQDAVLYFKFRRLRMMNRCDEAQPIELEEVIKREG